jgi:hypothetical protein
MSELPVSTLKQIIFGDDLELEESDPDNEPNPFEQLKHDGAVRAALAKSDRRASVTLDLSVPASDVDDDSGPLYQGPMIQKDEGPRTLAKRLGITRTEVIVAASGDRWTHAFNAAGDLVDARLLQSA